MTTNKKLLKSKKNREKIEKIVDNALFEKEKEVIDEIYDNIFLDEPNQESKE